MYTAEVFTLFVEDALFYFKLVDFNIVKLHSPFSVLVFYLRVPVDKSDHYWSIKMQETYFQPSKYFLSD